MTTPLHIEIGLHYYARVDDYRGGDFSAPAVRRYLDEMVSHGLLEASEGHRRYEPTEGLHVWIQALLQVPWPQRVWAMPSDIHTTDAMEG